MQYVHVDDLPPGEEGLPMTSGPKGPMNPMTSMGPPADPSRFSEQLAGSLTPPPAASRPISGAYDPGIAGGPETPQLFSDHMIHGLADERGIDLPPHPPLYEDEFLGQRKGDNYASQLHGVWDEDFNERPGLLNERLPGGMMPTARETMPAMRMGSSLERTFPGHNESMPEGAVGYVGRDEPYGWGVGGGPSMYPAEAVNEEFIGNKERDAGWSPPDVYDMSRTRFY